MAERSNAAVLKTVDGDEPSGGSNPSLSANQTKPRRGIFIGQRDPSLLERAMDNKNEVHKVPVLFGFSPLPGSPQVIPLSPQVNQCREYSRIFVLERCQACQVKRGKTKMIVNEVNGH